VARDAALLSRSTCAGIGRAWRLHLEQHPALDRFCAEAKRRPRILVVAHDKSDQLACDQQDVVDHRSELIARAQRLPHRSGSVIVTSHIEPYTIPAVNDIDRALPDPPLTEQASGVDIA
jgi:hypothetical protein